MEHKLATDEIKEQAALYALGALSQLEARAFENHLSDGCAVCQAELAEFDGVVGVLGLGAPPASPPPYLREMLSARIAKEPGNILSSKGSRARAAPGTLAPLTARRSPWVTALPWAVAACLAIVAVSSVLSLRRAIDASREAEREATRALGQAQQMNEMLGRANQRQAEQARIIAALNGGSSRIVLAAQKDAPQPLGSVYSDKQNKRWLVVADLTPAPPGKVYQLWFVTKASPVSAGLIKTDATGHGFLEVSIPSDLDHIAAAAITLEPEGGSATPTPPILAMGKTE